MPFSRARACIASRISRDISGSSCESVGVWASENQACRGRREGTVVAPRTRLRTKAGAGSQPIQASTGLREGPPFSLLLLDEVRTTDLRVGDRDDAPVGGQGDLTVGDPDELPGKASCLLLRRIPRGKRWARVDRAHARAAPHETAKM